MTPLRDKFAQLEDLLLHHRQDLAQNTGVPFLRLVYEPDDEVACRRHRHLLERTLVQAGVPVETVRCRGMIFTYYERRGRLERLFEIEQRDGERLRSNIARHTRETLTQELRAASDRLGEDGVIFLVDTAFVYPYLHLAAVLDDCTNEIVPPQALVVFYPGQRNVEGELLFLGKRASGYYRTRDLI